MEILIGYLFAGFVCYLAVLPSPGSPHRFNPLIFVFVVVGWLPLTGWIILREAMA